MTCTCTSTFSFSHLPAVSDICTILGNGPPHVKYESSRVLFKLLRVIVDSALGGRTAPEIVTWLSKKTGPPAVQVKTQEDLDKLKEDEVVVIGFFKVSFHTTKSILSLDTSK